jgi:HD-like signal output (HDOD) protein
MRSCPARAICCPIFSYDRIRRRPPPRQVTMSLLASLLRLFGGEGARAAGAADPAGTAVHGSEAATAQPAPAAMHAPAGTEGGSALARDGLHPFEGDPDRRFTALILGVGSLRRAEAGPSERRIIGQIEQLAQGARDPNLVPRLPVELPRLIGLVRRDDVSPRELAERLSRDPALVGEVVRMANSPRYRSGRDVANLQEAVIALGQSGLIQLVTGAVMRPIFDTRQGRFSRSAGTRLWDLTERCSFACDILCGGCPDRFHAYLAGMVANIGFIVALRVLDSGYQEVQPPDTEAFHDDLCAAVGTLSGQIAHQWDFHPDVCRAVAARANRRDEAAQDDLTRALRAADRISKWHVLAPGLAGSALAALDEPERRCYIELERAFGP